MMKNQFLGSECKTMFLYAIIIALFFACDKYNTPFPESTSISGGATLISKDFTDSSLTSGGWKEYSDTGAQIWAVSVYNNDYFAKMSGFVSPSNFANSDWLISPSFNGSGYAQVTLTFETAKNYTGNDIEVFVSTNYDGTSSPSSATWTKLTAVLSSGSFTWALSGNVDLSAYKGTATYIGFKYTSTNTESATWELDDIIVTGK